MFAMRLIYLRLLRLLIGENELNAAVNVRPFEVWHSDKAGLL